MFQKANLHQKFNWPLKTKHSFIFIEYKYLEIINMPTVLLFPEKQNWKEKRILQPWVIRQPTSSFPKFLP